MAEHTLDLVNAIASGDAVAAEDSFQAAMSEKIGAHLDAMRQTVAQNMFAQPEVEVETATEVEAETSTEE